MHQMLVSRRYFTAFLAVALLGGPFITAAGRAQAATPAPAPLRPPSVPLVAHDPYFSIWSPADELTGADTRHWTGKPHTLSSLVRIDGKTFRLMGTEPAGVPALPQTRLQVLPTRTIYQFGNTQVGLTLTFTTPAIPYEIEVLSRPVTYVTFEARSLDGAPHSVQVYSDAGAELAVNVPTQRVQWNRQNMGGLTALRLGSVDQPVLAKKGDDIRIDWGYLYVAAPRADGTQFVLGPRAEIQQAFVTGGRVPAADDRRMPRAANDARPVGAVRLELGRVGGRPVARMVMLAYDDLYSVTYMGRRLRPYWRRNGADASRLLQTAARDYASLQKRCADFDSELMADLARVGGERYARLTALAHRQALAAQKVVADAKGAPLMFSKENFSNGCVGTVDILYPAAPQLLLMSPTLTKASLVAILNYAASPRWKFPFAPHDLGTYPRADGQVYGGGERTEENQMPVEESGNMLILLAAVAKIDGNTRFCDPFWPQIAQWARYLEDKGFDPESQLSTDDFAGHLAHNVNLSAKAIQALGAYSILCEMRGDKSEATRVRGEAQQMANRWVREAKDGDHYRLAFDKPGTWSQKYNLVWDRILGLNLFPAEVFQQEMAFYRKNLNRYGLPLDNRQPYTKLDWTIWTAMLTGSRGDFEAVVAPVYDFLNATPDRNPMTDWYQTREPKQVGFQARAVVGGVFIPVLGDAGLWKKWADRDRRANGARPITWAPLPTPPQITQVVPSSRDAAQVWRYTFDRPADGWMAPGFNDAAWKSGEGGFGTRGTPSTEVRTEWNTSDIWARREFDLPAGADTRNLQLFMYHDEDAEVYINGVLAARVNSYSGTYDAIPMSAAARAALKPGRNVIAVHCHQTTGGQYIDVGLATVK